MNHDRLKAMQPWVLLGLLALVVRLAVVCAYGFQSGWTLPDPYSELAWIARNLAAGHGFSSPLGLGAAPTAWLAPLIPAAWAGVFRLFGDSTPATVVILLTANALASTVAVLLFYRLFCLLTARPSAAPVPWLWLAPLVLWPAGLRQVTVAWYFCFQEAAMAALCLALLEWWRSQFALRWTLITAAVGSVAAYINPSPLVVLGGFGVLALFRAPAPRRAFGHLALAAGILLLALLPWTARNYRALGRLIPMRSNFGVELRQGNHPEATVSQTSRSLHPALREDERRRFDQLGEAAYTADAQTQALRYMASEPATTAWRTLCRVYVFWCSDIADHWSWQARTPWWRGSPTAKLRGAAKVLLYNLPWLAAVTVLLLGWGRRVRHAWLIALVAALYPLPYYLTHVTALYAYPVQPYLLLFALAAASARTARQGRCAGLPRDTNTNAAGSALS